LVWNEKERIDNLRLLAKPVVVKCAWIAYFYKACASYEAGLWSLDRHLDLKKGGGKIAKNSSGIFRVFKISNRQTFAYSQSQITETKPKTKWIA
jgi:hypothetical protein